MTDLLGMIGDTDLAEQLRDAARDAAIAAAKAFGFGGDEWTVNGGDTITAYAFQQRPGDLRETEPGVAVGDSVWRAIIVSGDVRNGDRIQSVEDASLRFTISSIEPWYEYRRGELERTR